MATLDKEIPDQTAAAKLLEEVAIALGNPLKWGGAAKAMGMAIHHTAREYVALPVTVLLAGLAEAPRRDLMIVERSRRDPEPAP